MIKAYFIFYCLLLTSLSYGQEIWNIPEPIINDGAYRISDTVYIAVNGNDANAGTQNAPVASFDKAADLLPFGEVGVNDGHAYGLIRLLPGEYYLPNGYSQSPPQYESNNTYKNISIQGIGDVTLRGSRDTFARNQILRLRGSHIFIDNITIKYGDIHGILISSDAPQSHVRISNVEVDSVKGFSLLALDVDTILVEHSTFLRSSRVGFEDVEPGPSCQWPSGVKFKDSRYIIARGNEIAYTRGEGLNFHNSQYGIAYDNLLHDNPLNVYCDNSANIIIRNNLIYALPDQDRNWLTCPGASETALAPSGIMLANEGACSIGGPTYEDCQTKCNLEQRSFNQIDSIFIFNNIFQNTAPALRLWQGVTEPLGGPNCLRNIYFENNTIFGAVGTNMTDREATITAFFPNVYNIIWDFGYATVENANIRSNIIATPTMSYPNTSSINVTLDGTFPVPFDLRINKNLHNTATAEFDGTNYLLTNLLDDAPYETITPWQFITPCNENPGLIQEETPSPWIAYDYHYQPRDMTGSNVGAISYGANCNSSTTAADASSDVEFTLFPNPANEHINLRTPINLGAVDISLFSQTKLVQQYIIPTFGKEQRLNISKLPSGMYTLRIIHAQETNSIIFVVAQ